MSKILPLNSYRSLIDLQPRNFDRTARSDDYQELVRQVAEFLLRKTRQNFQLRSFDERRSFIRELLTLRHPASDEDLPQTIYTSIDRILLHERDHLKVLTDAKSLRAEFVSFPEIRVWRGDITTLIVDAIVNAANSQMLGCFQPTHLCIDNVIHAAAGPKLRDDCFRIMNQQRHSEPVGNAKITIGYNLPCKYVLHTVGPQIEPGRSVNKVESEQLSSCYASCLNLASQFDQIQSVAFCCISTGLFSFPADLASRIAIQTVQQWFDRHKSSTNIRFVVFNVFTPDDEILYRTNLR